MVKLLFCGDVGENWDKLVARVNELQASNHGPFHALFIVGKCGPGLSATLPLKTYVFDRNFVNTSESEIENIDHDVGIITAIQNLTIAYYVGGAQDCGPDYDYVNKIASGATYRGCDVLITSEWPREMHHFMDSSEYRDYQSLNISGGCKQVSSIATLLKPRYHFVGGKGCFFQRSPYRNAVNSDGQPSAYTRLISIDKVSDTKEKTHKWMHALSFNPIVNMTAAELSEEPNGTTDCPYVAVGEKRASHVDDGINPAKKSRFDESAAANNSTGGTGSFFFGAMAGGGGGAEGGNPASASLNLDAPSTTITTLFIGGLSREISDHDLRSSLPNAVQVKRPPGKSFAFVDFSSHAAAKKVIESTARQGGLSVKGRTLTVGWGKERETKGTSGGGRGHHPADGEDGGTAAGFVHERQLIPPSSDSKTLFVGGLPAFIDSHIPTSRSHYEPPPPPPSATETASSSSSAAAGSETALSPLEVALLDLFPNSVKVFKIPGKNFAFVEFDTYEAAMAVVTRSISETIALQGRALTVGWAKGETINSAQNRQQTRAILTAAPSEDSNVLFLGSIPNSAAEADLIALFPPSLQKSIRSVRRPGGREYAFVEFASAGEAQEAINGLTISSSGEEGAVGGGGAVVHGVRLTVGWAKGRAAEKNEQSSDCWFCLASPVVKVHLVVSVGEHSYLALPRGGLNDNHIMISPIDCVPSRVHLSTDAKLEIVKYQECLDQLYRKLGFAAIRFERALRTKGSRDHMQVQVVPLPLKTFQGSRAADSFLQKANGVGLKFHEITDARSIDEVVVTMEGGPYQEYFYLEIPSEGGAKLRRFVYVHEVNSPRFPMQFGVELVAEIMGQPERGHWKNCLLSEQEEKRLAEKFRDNFTPYDFTQ